MRIIEVIEIYGAAVAANEDYEMLVTFNNSYFNIWVNRGDDDWNNTEAFSVSSRFEHPSKAKYWDVIERAEELIKELIEEEEEEEE